MRKTTAFVLLTLYSFLNSAVAADAELKAKVESFYEEYREALESKDLEKTCSFFASDYLLSFKQPGTDYIYEIMGRLFEAYEELQIEINVVEVERVGKYIKVLGDGIFKGKKHGDSDWTELIGPNTAFIDLLKVENDVFKVYSTAEVKKEILKYLQGRTYKNDDVGFSLTAPEDWILVPSSLPNMLESVQIIAPDGVSTCTFGYLELSCNLGTKEAAEADDAIMRRVASEEDFEVHLSRAITVAGMEGYETLTSFDIPGDVAPRRRWRVYLAAGGLLYCFIFDAVPQDSWDRIQPAFEAILNSFSFADRDRSESVNRAREISAKGEIVGRIYTNAEYGCQIAAPDGWRIESTNIGAQTLFCVNVRPPKGKSLVRFLAADTMGVLSLEDVVKKQNEAISTIDENAEIGPTEVLEVGGHEGTISIKRFSLKGLGTMKRKSAFFLVDDIVYCFVCDAMPPDKFDELESKFDEIIQSFTLN